eukprot:gene1993-1501_t
MEENISQTISSPVDGLTIFYARNINKFERITHLYGEYEKLSLKEKQDLDKEAETTQETELGLEIPKYMEDFRQNKNTFTFEDEIFTSSSGSINNCINDLLSTRKWIKKNLRFYNESMDLSITDIESYCESQSVEWKELSEGMKILFKENFKLYEQKKSMLQREIIFQKKVNKLDKAIGELEVRFIKGFEKIIEKKIYSFKKLEEDSMVVLNDWNHETEEEQLSDVFNPLIKKFVDISLQNKKPDDKETKQSTDKVNSTDNLENSNKQSDLKFNFNLGIENTNTDVFKNNDEVNSSFGQFNFNESSEMKTPNFSSNNQRTPPRLSSKSKKTTPKSKVISFKQNYNEVCLKETLKSALAEEITKNEPQRVIQKFHHPKKKKILRVNYCLGKLSELPNILVKNSERLLYPIDKYQCERFLNNQFDRNEVDITSKAFDLNSKLLKTILSFLNPTTDLQYTSLQFSKLVIIPPCQEFNYGYNTSTNQIGSLFIQLPSFYLGGEMHLKRDDKELSNFDFSMREGDSLHMNWIAFHNNCRIKIDPIESGHQMILIYKLLNPTLNNENFDFDEPISFSGDLINFMNLKGLNEYSIALNNFDFDGRNLSFDDSWIFKTLMDNWSVDIEQFEVKSSHFDRKSNTDCFMNTKKLNKTLVGNQLFKFKIKMKIKHQLHQKQFDVKFCFQ